MVSENHYIAFTKELILLNVRDIAMTATTKTKLVFLQGFHLFPFSGIPLHKLQEVRASPNPESPFSTFGSSFYLDCRDPPFSLFFSVHCNSSSTMGCSGSLHHVWKTRCSSHPVPRALLLLCPKQDFACTAPGSCKLWARPLATSRSRSPQPSWWELVAPTARAEV